MKQIGIKDARQCLPDLIDRVEAGEEITITRQGKAVARLVPAPVPMKKLPSLKGFRHELGNLGTPSSKILRKDRDAR